MTVAYFKYGHKKYFPDFYLPKSETYLDVKNDYLIKVDEAKITAVKRENPTVKLIVFTLDDMEETLAHLIQNTPG